MSETILVINAGSSSIKFQLFAVGAHDRLDRRMKGQVEGIGTRPRLLARDATGQVLADETWPDSDVGSVPAALDKLVLFLRQQIGGRLPTAVGHRVVHGGPDYSEPTIIGGKVLDGLKHFIPLAPLHQPNNLAAAMGGMDGFVFTAGIGENAPSIRDAVMRRLSWLGVEIASEANAKGKTRISREASRVACFVIPTDEELMIARHTLRMLREQPAAPLRERRA